MKSQRIFWAALFIALAAHAAVFASVYLVLPRAAHASNTLPILMVRYGDSDREGLAVATVAPDPGTLRQGNSNTPGGDKAPKPSAEPPPPAPPPPPETPKPDKPPELEPPPPPALPKEPMPPPVVVAAEKTAAPDAPSAPAPPSPPAPVSSASRIGAPAAAAASPALPGEPGGSRLKLGTPSAGGTVGSINGVRIADGARPPAYPSEAREAGIEGTPVIWLRISASGEVLDARVHRSSGYRILDDAALQWARTQKFIPASRDGVAVKAEVNKPVHFYLY